MSRLLSAAGHSLCVFSSGADFLRSGQAERVASVVCDLQMPGMSGLELQETLAAIHILRWCLSPDTGRFRMA